MADDLGYETISANGGTSYQTPEIDEMAQNGIRFDHCYAQPLCTPSRVQIMTGIYNVRNYVRFGWLDTSQVTFGHLFQDAGYATCVIGKWQLGKEQDSPQKAGFDEHCLWQVQLGRADDTGRDTRFSMPVLETNGWIDTFGRDDYGPDIVSNYGLEFMEKCSQNQQPFLLYYPMILTHCPFSATPESASWMSDDTTIMRYKGTPSYFPDMMTYTDMIIGGIKTKLKELDLYDQTMIIFTGDNGTDVPIVSNLDGRPVPGAKGKSTDAGTRVPLIIQWPAEIESGQTSNDLVDFSDVLPTICDAAGIIIPESLDIDGHSFLPQLQGERGEPRRWVYNWYSRSGEPEKARIFARNQEFKLYHTGEFYLIPEDDQEQHPLDRKELSDETEAVYHELEEVLKFYEDRRLDAISP
jgi:arylsulfatase A